MSTQPEALRLADALGIVSVGGPLTVTMHEAAAELRRLLSESLRIEALHAQAQRELFDAKEELQSLRSDPAIHYCHRFAILMECVMLGGVDKYWDEMGTLLDEYHKARDAWATAHGQPYVSGFGKD